MVPPQCRYCDRGDNDRGDNGRGGKKGVSEFRIDGVGRVRMRDNGDIKVDLFGKAIEVEVNKREIEVETNRDMGNIKAELNMNDMSGKVRVQGMGKIRVNTKDNRIEVMLSATKVAATATVLAAVALY